MPITEYTVVAGKVVNVRRYIAEQLRRHGRFGDSR